MADMEPIQADEVELAFARLEWVRAAHCFDVPSQREALEWHVACWEAALTALENQPPD